MKSKLIALASVAAIVLTAAAIPNQAEAYWRGYRSSGWWGPGAVVGGFALGAAIASRPYYGYAYAPGPYAYDYDYGPTNMVVLTRLMRMTAPIIIVADTDIPTDTGANSKRTI